jgi:hypothetical protein
LHLVAGLGLADSIGEEPVSVEQLASEHQADPDAIDRVLALLAAYGIFSRHERAYAHTDASRLLRSDHPMSLRAFPEMNGLPVFGAVFANLEHSLRTGAPAIKMVDPAGLWGYLDKHPDEAGVFGRAMSARAAADIAAILDAYDFSRFETIADIGGGRGHLLCAVLDSSPSAHGVLFDLPTVIDALDLQHERITPQRGDFFADALPSADAYVLMEILHDWGDPECTQILSAIRRAAKPGATLLVIEGILPGRGTDPGAHTLDVIMLAVTGGRERTLAELNDLFVQAGFTPGTAIETTGRVRLIEAAAI